MTRLPNLLYVLVFLLLGFAASTPARAELEIDLNRGVVEPIPVAVTDFQAAEPEHMELAQTLPGVIRANLESSGLFKTLSSDLYIQSLDSLMNDGPRFAEWRAISAQALVYGRIRSAPDGRTRVEYYLWDVLGQKQLKGMAYTTTPDSWRRIAHIISDDIYHRITGEKGYFDSRIVYVAEEGPANRRQKRLAIMDQDGRNHRYLTSGANLVLTPRFSPTENVITYMAYHNRKPRVYLYNIDTGRQELLGDFPGMTFAPRFSPDGRSVIMSLAKSGNSDIYVLDLDTRRSQRLTTQPGIDTSPSFAPDGKKVVFESDRGGSQQLYVMNADGSNQHRITFGDGRYANPVWSPRGDVIAFTRMYKGEFYIGVIRPDGTGERLISSAFHVEGPSWSPNGRYLVYFKEQPYGPRRERRRVRLYTIDLTGYNERELPTPKDGSDPAWSPLLGR